MAALWTHQQRVFDLLMSGQNVILQAPTGTGKTRAALYPFLYGLGEVENSSHYDRLPRKCIYSVPMRVLANQFHAEYQKTADKYGLKYGFDISTAIQTGEHAEDNQLTANLIFATIDQTLSSFLLSPYSLPRRRANLNAGAILASYLVFDEFHLFDPASTLPTTLHMLRMLKGITPFILMTATFSSTMLDGLADLLDAVVVPGSEQERTALLALPPQQKTRRYHTIEGPLSANRVLEAHRGQSLVICNTVSRAQYIYEQLRDRAGSDVETMLLHGRFLPGDRHIKEERLRDHFGKPGTNMIVVATQAIEVGVDISSTALHTELAPANAIIQRAGRCARYEGEAGDVYIYRRSHDADGAIIDLFEKPNPYKSQAALFAPTFDAFAAYNGAPLKFTDEQAVLSDVHSAQDQKILEDVRIGDYDHRRSVFAALNGEGDVRKLIREVFQQRVTIHHDPEQLKAAPFDAPSFGLHPGTIQRYLKGKKDEDLDAYVGGWLARDDLEWTVKYLHEVPDDEQSNHTVYKWEPVYTPETAVGAPLLVINPALATYDPELGFLPDRGGDWCADLPEREQFDRPNFSYHLETYQRHIELVHQAYIEFWPELAWAARQLEHRFGWEVGSVQRAAELAVLLHDVGKLSTGWQGWVRDYQQRIGMPAKPGQAYAHTELQGDTHREIEKRMRRRPWHAVEGAVAVVPVLASVFGSDHPLLDAAFAAIARHHAPFSDENKAFQLQQGAPAQIIETFQSVRYQTIDQVTLLGQDAAVDASVGKALLRGISYKAGENELGAYLAYLVIVRVLRRADAAGTEKGSR